MFRILLGMAIGAAAAATYLQRPGNRGNPMRRRGRVNELSAAGDNVIADPEVNAGDGTTEQERAGSPTRAINP